MRGFTSGLNFSRKICSSKQFVQRALSETGELLKTYGKSLRPELDLDSIARKQKVHKFRYKVYFYIDWIEGSFSQFGRYSLPLVELLLNEIELGKSRNNKLSTAHRDNS